MKPCPLCNSTDIRMIEEAPARKDGDNYWFIDDPEYIIECDNCGHEARGWSVQEVEEEWDKGEISTLEKRWWEHYCKENN